MESIINSPNVESVQFPTTINPFGILTNLVDFTQVLPEENQGPPVVIFVPTNVTEGNTTFTVNVTHYNPDSFWIQLPQVQSLIQDGKIYFLMVKSTTYIRTFFFQKELNFISLILTHLLLPLDLSQETERVFWEIFLKSM